jgi:hypothetical protein
MNERQRHCGTASRTGPSPASCGDATGARWHIKHYFFQYDRHGTVAGPRLPALSGAPQLRIVEAVDDHAYQAPGVEV